ncbi:MAG: sigma-70 RNA polymerase sigma factor region 4 domain-containing protein [Minisyncoccota bacterium]
MIDELEELEAQGDGRPGYKGLDFVNWTKRDGIRADPAQNIGIIPSEPEDVVGLMDLESSFVVSEVASLVLDELELRVVSMVYYFNKTMEEVADKVDLSVDELKTVVNGALAKMKAVLEEPPVIKVKVEKDRAHFRLSGNFPLATK